MATPIALQMSQPEGINNVEAPVDILPNHLLTPPEPIYSSKIYPYAKLFFSAYTNRLDIYDPDESRIFKVGNTLVVKDRWGFNRVMTQEDQTLNNTRCVILYLCNCM